MNSRVPKTRKPKVLSPESECESLVDGDPEARSPESECDSLMDQNPKTRSLEICRAVKA
jgi:hypothetical protein